MPLATQSLFEAHCAYPLFIKQPRVLCPWSPTGPSAVLRMLTNHTPVLLMRHVLRCAPRVSALVLGLSTTAYAQAVDTSRYDVLITGGSIIDGTGAARYSGDVALRGDRIVAVSRTALPRARAARVVEARGLIVAPGFIDMHAHIEPLLNQPDATSAVRQGVTLSLGGPDGGGPWPFADYLNRAAALPLGP